MAAAEEIEDDFDFEVEVKIRVPRAAFKRLHRQASKLNTTPNRLGSAVVAAVFGVEVVPEPEEPEQRGPRLTDPGVREAVERMLAKGASNAEIAARFEIGFRTASKWRSECGGPFERRRGGSSERWSWTDERLAEFQRMYAAGATDREIAAAIGARSNVVMLQRKLLGMLPNEQGDGAR